LLGKLCKRDACAPVRPFLHNFFKKTSAKLHENLKILPFNKGFNGFNGTNAEQKLGEKNK